MPSLRELAVRAAEQDALDTLAARVVTQQALLDDAISDLNAARARLGAPVETPDLPFPTQPGGPRLSPEQVRATARLILTAGRRARGEEPIPVPQYVPPAQPPSTPEGTAALAKLIIDAGRKARGEV